MESSRLIPSVYEKIVAHLEILSTSFDRYFDVGKMETSEEWIVNPCSINLDKMQDDGELKEDFINVFKSCSWNAVWEYNFRRLLVLSLGHLSRTVKLH